MDQIIANSLSVLRTTPKRWEDLAACVAGEVMRMPPAPDEWSALECLAHLVEVEREVFPVRVEALLAGRDFPAFDPDAQSESRETPGEPAALASKFSRLRAKSLKTLNRLADSDLSRSARHSELGRVTLSELLHEWTGHDLMHTIQAERALMQPFIRGCGPWKVYFADHVVGDG